MKKIRNGVLRSRVRFLELKNTLLEENHHRLNEIYKENARLYHDMNHHFQMISYLAQKAGNTEIMDYVTSISEPIRQLPDVIWSGVDLIDAILNHILTLADARGIRMDMNVEFPNACIVTADDICVILFNLLDNALENTKTTRTDPGKADSKIDAPVISVTIRKIEQFLMIKVQNPCCEVRKKRFGRFFSTKANPLHHGIMASGLKMSERLQKNMAEMWKRWSVTGNLPLPYSYFYKII